MFGIQKKVQSIKDLTIIPVNVLKMFQIIILFKVVIPNNFTGDMLYLGKVIFDLKESCLEAHFSKMV